MGEARQVCRGFQSMSTGAMPGRSYPQTRHHQVRPRRPGSAWHSSTEGWAAVPKRESHDQPRTAIDQKTGLPPVTPRTVPET